MLIDVRLLLLSELGQHLGVLRVVRTIMHDEVLLEDVFTQFIFGNHALNSSVNSLMGIFLKQLSQAILFKTTKVLSVVSVQLLIFLAASDH